MGAMAVTAAIATATAGRAATATEGQDGTENDVGTAIGDCDGSIGEFASFNNAIVNDRSSMNR
jgi:hypothetical protein